ncbi:hypothetical protein D3C78_391930 [compost metagenome]
MLGGLGGTVGQATGLTGVVGVLLDRGGQLFHARSGIFQRGGLLYGTGRQAAVAVRDFLGDGVDQLAAVAHGAHGGGQVLLDMRQGNEQLADFVAAAHLDLAVQLAGGDLLAVLDHLLQRADDVLRNPPEHADDGRRGHQQRQHDDPAHHAGKTGEGLLLLGSLLKAGQGLLGEANAVQSEGAQPADQHGKYGQHQRPAHAYGHIVDQLHHGSPSQARCYGLCMLAVQSNIS